MPAFEIQALLYRLLRNWWLLLIGLALGYAAAKAILRYRDLTYQVSAVVQIEEDKSGGVSEQIIVQELGYENERNLETEIQMMKSRSLLKVVVERLNLDMNYLTNGRVRNIDLYGSGNVPVKLVKRQLSENAYDKLLTLNVISDDRFAFGFESDIDTFRLGLPFSGPYGTFLFERDSSVTNAVPELVLQFKIPEKVAQVYGRQLVIKPITASNLLEMSLIDEVPERATDVIRQIIETYDSITIGVRNQGTDKTLTFIDERIEEFNQELTSVEQRAEEFISNNNLLVDIPTNLSLQLEEFRETEQQIATLRLQLAGIDNLSEYLQSENKEFQLIPFTAEMGNLNIGSFIQQYNTLLLDRKQLLISAGPGNPALQITEEPLLALENNILDAITRARADTQRQIDAVETKNSQVLARVRGVPGQRRELLSIEREQGIKEQLYLFLLQKREETGLAQAVTGSGLRIVEAPINEGAVGPASSQIYLLGLALGLLLPIGGLTIAEFLDNTVKSTEHLKALTNVPVIGAIGTSNKNDNIVVTPTSRTPVAEMFRSVRTNLAFIGAGQRQKVILITSSMSGEGKSFISLNMGMSLAISDKRVCLVGMDLRKPKLELYITNTQGGDGVSTYLVRPDMTIDNIVRQSKLHPNLDYIGSGPIPPNPAELLMTDRLTLLVESLRDRYDYVIVDSPPVGAVVDGFLLRKVIDTTVYVTRYGKTAKGQLRILNEAVEKGQLTNPSVLLNGVKTGRGYYDYGYGYGTYNED